MITKLRIKNFKALRDVEIDLTPIHVLIGPNDSGKTSILDALAALCRTVDHTLSEAFLGYWKGSELVWTGEFGLPVTVEVDFDKGTITGYAFTALFAERYRREALVDEEIIKREGQAPLTSSDLGTLGWEGSSTRVKRASEDPNWKNP